MKTIIVTGGAGFIGSHLTDLLIQEGYKVIVIDNLSSGKKKNINKKAKFYRTDIRFKRGLRRIFKEVRPDYVFHLAAAAKIPWCTDHPQNSFDINVQGTLNLLELSKQYKVKGFVYSSSSSVYGEVKTMEPIGEDNLTRPVSIYGLEKLQAEQLVTIYALIYGLPTISLRYFNVYGTSRQSPDGPYPNVFSSFIRDNKEKGKVTIFGTGKQERDFIHVYDVARANVNAMELLKTKHECFYGQVFNIGTGITTSINKITKKLGFKARYAEARMGDPKYSCASVRKTKKLLKFNSHISLDDGIGILLKSYEK